MGQSQCRRVKDRGAAPDTQVVRGLALIGVLLALLLAGTSTLGTDYRVDAGPAVSALARGDLHGFVTAQPQMGPLSLVLRAPAAAAAPSELWAYRGGALLCLLALAGLVVMIAGRASLGAGIVTAGVLLAGGPTLEALRLGHPEELLLAGLCVAALLLAPRRPALAGLVLGAALATKQTALIAIAPALLAAPAAGRRRLAAWAGGTAAAIVLPGALAAPHAFLAALDHPAFGFAALRGGNPWLAVADAHRIALGTSSVNAYVVPDQLQHVAHPAIALLTLGAGVLALRRRPGTDPLALLALLFLARCALDPWDHAYYHLPFLAALAAWEVLRRGRPPWLAAVSTAWLAVVFRMPIEAGDLAYLAWAAPTALWLWWAPGPVASALRPRLRSAGAV